MTTLPVWSHVFCLTEIDGVTWRTVDHATNKIKKIIKGQEIKGYFDVSVGSKDGQTTTKRYTDKNKKEFLDVLYGSVARKINSLNLGDFDIVPIPNKIALKDCRGSYPTLAHANEIAKLVRSKPNVIDAMRWKTELPQAHKSGGPRDPTMYIDHLSLRERPKKPILLFDDLITSGSQMIAATRKLKRHGCNPVVGIVIGRAVKDQRDKMIGWTELELEIEEHPISWDDF